MRSLASDAVDGQETRRRQARKGRIPPVYLTVGLLVVVTTLFFLVTNGYFGEIMGMGGVERWVAYPVMLWILGLGGYLLGAGSKDVTKQ